MNKLPLAKRVQILNLLCEGMSMRAVARVSDVSFNTVAIATTFGTFEEVLGEIDKAQAPKARGSYKKRAA